MRRSVILKIAPKIFGSISTEPDGKLSVSAIDVKTGRTLLGDADDAQQALHWLDKAKLMLSEAEGHA